MTPASQSIVTQATKTVIQVGFIAITLLSYFVFYNVTVKRLTLASLVQMKGTVDPTPTACNTNPGLTRINTTITGI